MATVYHTYKQPRATKKWNDKDAANLPASVMLGFDVTSVVDPVDPSTFNVTVSGASDGAGGWYSSLRLPNGILIEEVVETIATFAVSNAGLIGTTKLIICRCAWAADEFLQPTYEHITIANFNEDTDVVIGFTIVYNPSLVVYTASPGAINWPIDRIHSLSGVKQKLSVPFGAEGLAPTGAAITTQCAVIPQGFSRNTLQNTTPEDFLKFTMWARMNGAPGVGESVVVRYLVYLYWDPKDGTGGVTYGPAGLIAPAKETVAVDAYGLSDPVKLIAEADVSSLLSSIPLDTSIPAEAYFRVVVSRDGDDVSDTYAHYIYLDACSLEIIQTRPGEAF